MPDEPNPQTDRPGTADGDPAPEGEPRERVVAARGHAQDLRPKVDSLLEAPNELAEMLAAGALGPGESLFEVDANEISTRISHSVAAEGVGSRIGHYKLLQEIGEGGFGMVYMAEQMEPVKRRVALKIVKPGMDSREVIARFEAERQALALMNHPNIASVHDAGMTDTGRPYFVLELVKGIPLIKFCDRKKLDTGRRLKLFLDVCGAIQHAHQKGVIHRDIKPSNIMITQHDGEPVVKVIDFGIAKALDQELTEKTLFTAYGQMIGTPQYMSPEQAEMSGLDIDTRSDIYSLGVLLYELLTGTTPLDPGDLRTAAYDEIQRRICHETPQKPSTHFNTLSREEATVIAESRGEEPGKIGRFVRGDLDWIVLKALDKDRERRYGTARELAKDVERFLKHEPVSATPPTLAYQFSKFAHRHRGVLTASAIVLISLLIGVVGMTLLYIRAEADRRSATNAWQAAEDQAEKVKLERDRAIEAERQAELEKQIAEAKRAEAEAASLAEAVQRKRAQAEADRADREAEQARASLYGASMRLAAHAWEDDRAAASEVEQALASQISLAGETDLRDFAWRLQWNELRHSAAATSIHAAAPAIAFNDTGAMLSYDGSLSLKVWNSDDAFVERRLGVNYEGAGETFVFSPDGRYLAARGTSGFQLFATETGKQLFILPGDTRRQPAMFSADGGYLLTRGRNRALQVFDVATGKARHQWKLPTGQTRLLALAAGGDSLIISGPANLEGLRIFSPDTGRSVPLRGHTADVRAFATASSGLVAASGDGGGGVCVWNLADGALLHRFAPRNSAVSALAFSRDQSRLAVGCVNGQALVLDLASKAVARSFKGHASRVVSLAFFPDGRRLASGGDDRTLRIWELEQKKRKNADFGQVLRRVAYSPDGKWLATIGDRETILIDREADQVVQTFPYSGWSLTFAPDSRLLAIGAAAKEEHTIRFWNLTENRWEDSIHPRDKLVDLARSGAEVGSLAFSPDGSLIVSGQGIPHQRYNGMLPVALAVWKVSDRMLVKDLRTHLRSIVDLAFSSDGKRMVSASYDHRFQIWDVASWSSIRSVRVSANEIHAMALSPDGKTIATTAADDKAVNLWSLETGESLELYEGHSAQVTDLAFSPDGRTLASASLDQTVKLWDLRCGLDTRTLRSNSGSVHGLAFSRDGSELASATAAGALRIWKAPVLERIDEDPLTLRFWSDSVVRLFKQGDRDEAFRQWERIVYAQERILGADHPDTLTSRGILGKRLKESGRFDEAAMILAQAAAVSVNKLGKSHSISASQRSNVERYADFHRDVLKGRGDVAGLKEWYERLLPYARQIHGSERLGALQFQFGKTLFELGEFAAAAAQLEESLANRRALQPLREPLVGDSSRMLGITLSRLGGNQSSRAESLLREALKLEGAAPSPQRQDIQQAKSALAAILAKRGGRVEAEAEKLWLECAASDEDRAITAASAAGLAAIYERRGDQDKTRQWRERQKASEISLAKVAGVDPIDVLKTIDPQVDALEGKWRLQDGALIGDGSDFRSRIAFKAEAPAAYRVELEVTRLAGIGSFNVGLKRGPSRFLAIFDGANFHHVVGLDYEGLQSFESEAHPAASRGFRFQNGESRKLVCVVTEDRLELHADDKLHVSWKETFQPPVSLPEKWKTEKPVFFIGQSVGASFRIDSWTIVPLE